MPRTKITKNSKRNRDAANREERIRSAESRLDEFLTCLDSTAQDYITAIDSQMTFMISKLNSKLLQMKMSDFFDLELMKFDDFRSEPAMTPLCNSTVAGSISTLSNSSVQQTSSTRSKILNPNDEGYLTEDSSTGSVCPVNAFTSNTSSISSLQQQPSLSHLRSLASQQQQRLLRTPGGPMASARAARPRRSRSASSNNNFGSAIKPQLSAKPSEHASRNKLRTPMASRTKAFSADRTPKIRLDRSLSPKSPPTAILRWPKPGEIVLSKCGSPVVAQVMPDKFANVNIPVRNGVLSLQPKKLSNLNKDLLDSIDPDTLNQIRTLNENLSLIMNMAGKFPAK